MRLFLTLLLGPGLTISALAQPAGTNPTDEERAVIEAVARAGGNAAVDPTLPAAARVAATFDSLGDGALAALKKSPQIGSLDAFDATRCTDKGFALLKDFPNLRRLTLGKSGVTPTRARSVAQCKELRRLSLIGSGLSDAELALLKPLTNLVTLDVSGNPQVTDRGMATVKTFERLQALYLGKTGITDKGLMELKGLDGLRSLNVVGTKVTGDAAEKFADDMPNLRAVRR